MKCKICDQEFDLDRFYRKDTLAKKQMCFDCNFWQNRLEDDAKLPPHTVCMIDGHHYIIGPEDDPETQFRGFGGYKFVIEFFDGVQVTTTNLWYQGEPGEAWKEKFPNNALFVDNFKWEKFGTTDFLVMEEPVTPF